MIGRSRDWMSLVCLRTVSASIVLLAGVASAQSPLKIDFSRMPDEQPLQDGWLAFVGEGTDIFTESYPSNELAGPDQTVMVTIEGNTHWRDYRAATGDFEPLSDLLSDGPLCNAPCTMIVTLENLLDGSYLLTAYFHTTQFGPQDGRPFTPFEIRLTDGLVNDALIDAEKFMSDDTSDELSTEEIPFTVVDGSPVQLILEKLSPTNDHMALPGFELAASSTEPRLMPGDADQDLDFDQLDLVRVQIAAKYLTGQRATWGDGDWDGAPGGSVGNPPPGDGLFNQLDIIGALSGGVYLTGRYAAIAAEGVGGDSQTSVGYNAQTGEVWVDASAGAELTSINIDSAGGVFTGDPAQNLGGSFDNDTDGNIFKATFGGSFGSISFGAVAQPGLSQDFLTNDLMVVGSLAGGGALGDVDLVYIAIPEPSAILLLGPGLAAMLTTRRRRR